MKRFLAISMPTQPKTGRPGEYYIQADTPREIVASGPYETSEEAVARAVRYDNGFIAEITHTVRPAATIEKIPVTSSPEVKK